MALSTGRLNRRVTIRRASKVKDPRNGDLVTQWNDLRTVCAEVIGVSGREAMMAQALQGVSAFKVTMRFGVDVTDADQLRYGSIDLNIRSVSDPDGMREQLLILADTESVQANG